MTQHWKKIALGTGIAVTIALGAVLAAVSRQPSTVTVSHHQTIAATPQAVRPLLTDLRSWAEWNGLNANANPTFSEPSSGVGAHCEWQGTFQAGRGRVEIRSIAEDRIEYGLQFFEPLESRARIEMNLEPRGDRSVQVTWRLRRSRSFAERLLGLFRNTNVSPDFALGLPPLNERALVAQAELDRIEAERLAEAARVEALRLQAAVGILDASAVRRALQAAAGGFLDASATTAGRGRMTDELGSMMGDQIGSNFGFGGLGLRADPSRSNGEGIGLGNFGTLGRGHGASTGAASEPAARVRTGDPQVTGSLSGEVVRRVIRRHLGEVRFCYEQGLHTRANLTGTVGVNFTISATGTVSRAAIGTSTLADSAVQQCIASAVQRWTFPAPEGGGSVNVTIPFTLEPPAP